MGEWIDEPTEAKECIMIALVALWALWWADPSHAMVYIDPSCAVQGNGTAGEPCANAPGGAGPRNTWAGMPWVSGETYAQRANSVYVGMVDVTTSGASKADRITLTTYGDGARAIIRGTGQQFGDLPPWGGGSHHAGEHGGIWR